MKKRMAALLALCGAMAGPAGGGVPSSLTEEEARARFPLSLSDDGARVQLPALPPGAKLTLIGADLEQVVDARLRVYPPLEDKLVQIDFALRMPGYNGFLTLPIQIPGAGGARGANPKPAVLPAIQEWQGGSGSFIIGARSRLAAEEPALRDVLQTAAQLLEEALGFPLEQAIAPRGACRPGDIFLTLQTQDKAMGGEGCRGEIADVITLEANTETGLIWGLQTLAQLARGHALPRGCFRDYPRYPVRGLVFDIGRRPVPLEALREVVRQLSRHKMNDLHLHLNDNAVKLDAFQDVWEAYSAFRLESNVEGLTARDFSYTKAEFLELTRYAKSLGVKIVPEIDVPSHALAMTKARRDLALAQRGKNAEMLDLNNKDTLPFVQGIFEEYLSDGTFEGAVVHMGADEYAAKHSRAFRRFSNDMIDFLQARGKTVRMWGSLTGIGGRGKIHAEGVQMNLWNNGWAEPKAMYDQGFSLINTNDEALYIVPDAGYYHEWLDLADIEKNWQPNLFGGVRLPAGSPRVLGAAFALWNDMIETQPRQTPTIDDLLERIVAPLPVIAPKLW
ncbi:MAG: family 20 glycosylhydrolase [Oscillospiraceae bacterium]|nr:family 20 glycosylhydrolase [Oscillospiraceae bacterium]